MPDERSDKRMARGKLQRTINDIEYLKEHASEAARLLVTQMSSDNPKIAQSAALAILDRVHGKPIQQTEAHVELDSRVQLRAEIRAALVAQAEGRLTGAECTDD